MNHFSDLEPPCSPNYRSRANSTLSATAAGFQDLTLQSTSRSSSFSVSNSPGHYYQQKQPTSSANSPLIQPSPLGSVFSLNSESLPFSAPTSAETLAQEPSSYRDIHSNHPGSFAPSQQAVQDVPTFQINPATTAPPSTFAETQSLLPENPSSQGRDEMSTIGYSLPTPFPSFNSQYPYCSTGHQTMQEEAYHHLPILPSQGSPETMSHASLSPNYVQLPSSSDSFSGMSVEEREVARQRRRHSQNARRISRSRPNRDRSPSILYQRPNSRQEMAMAMAVSSSASMNQPVASTPPELAMFPSPYYGSPVPSVPQYLDTLTGQPQQYVTNDFNMPPEPTPMATYSTWPPPSMVPTSMSSDPIPQRPFQPIASSGSLSPGLDEQVRVVGSRPKPQCWEHGCNGRQFSTFSNLLRHQREKSGTAAKSECPRCGAVFTRSTARNGHMAHDKCKSRRNSDS
ncbi:MAG: hypothetical protein M1834_003742 [Cirrosporium novae-zelandiae]|nr:MAG: hypothetical protein M1834_003742 [Cirrosporium novae-zelandiae]